MKMDGINYKWGDEMGEARERKHPEEDGMFSEP